MGNLSVNDASSSNTEFNVANTTKTSKLTKLFKQVISHDESAPLLSLGKAQREAKKETMKQRNKLINEFIGLIGTEGENSKNPLSRTVGAVTGLTQRARVKDHFNQEERHVFDGQEIKYEVVKYPYEEGKFRIKRVDHDFDSYSGSDEFRLVGGATLEQLQKIIEDINALDPKSVQKSINDK